MNRYKQICLNLARELYDSPAKQYESGSLMTNKALRPSMITEGLTKLCC